MIDPEIAEALSKLEGEDYDKVANYLKKALTAVAGLSALKEKFAAETIKPEDIALAAESKIDGLKSEYGEQISSLKEELSKVSDTLLNQQKGEAIRGLSKDLSIGESHYDKFIALTKTLNCKFDPEKGLSVADTSAKDYLIANMPDVLESYRDKKEFPKQEDSRPANRREAINKLLMPTF